MDPAAYIATHLPHALASQSTYGVPASVSLAQGALESGWGESVLALFAHAHHGIKASSKPGVGDNPHASGVVNKRTGEWYGEWTTVEAAFLAYPTDADGYLGHGYYLRNRGIYGKAFAAGTHVGFVRAVAAAGYATDPAYADKVLDLIDLYRLTAYDNRPQEPEEAPMRIVIMPSSQEHNACKMGDTEQAHTRLIAKRTADILKAAGHDARYVIAGDDAQSDSVQLQQMAAASNALKPDLHVDIHTDAGGATGSTVFYIGSGRSKALGEAVYAELVKAVPFTPHGVRERGTLYMLRKTTASAILVECWPHDKIEQARWGHANIEKVSQAIARGVLKIAPAPTPAPSKTNAPAPTQETDMQLTDPITLPDGRKTTVGQLLGWLDVNVTELRKVVMQGGVAKIGSDERTDLATEAAWNARNFSSIALSDADVARVAEAVAARLAPAPVEPVEPVVEA